MPSGLARGHLKNDQAYVEQRNWLAVRRQVGYDRLASKQAYALLGELYPLLCLHLNFLRPLRKVVAKERAGARVSKRYDEPRTPCQRLLDSSALSDEERLRLQEKLLNINPVELRRRIDALLHRIWNLGPQERKLETQLG